MFFVKKVPSLGNTLQLSESGLFIVESRYTPGEGERTPSGWQLKKTQQSYSYCQPAGSGNSKSLYL